MQDKTDILIFDVGMGQSIFIYPHSQPEYGLMIDCGNTEEFDPVDFLLKGNWIPNKILGNLTLTNYDQDHFSGLPNLKDKIKIKTIAFAGNLNSQEIKDMKEEITDALEHTCEIKDTYTDDAKDHKPPYIKRRFYLNKQDLENPDTNNLSQIVFVEHQGTVICVSGDLEEIGWKTLIEKQPEIKEWLKRTNIFVASHHGRDNGYCADVFSYCKPECIVISDKGIVHDTQKDMCSVYGNCISGEGICLVDDISNKKRKVLTTRDDGHIGIRLFPNGARYYSTFSHE